MTNALVSKELRETAGITLLGLAVLLLVAAVNIGFNPLSLLGLGSGGRNNTIPFVSDAFAYQFGLAAFALAAVLGFRQAVADFSGDAQLVLLHLPITRQKLYLIKLLVGLSIYLLCGLVPIVLYAWWASTPGTHPSPFEWSMTGETWIAWLAMTAVYLGTFLAGIRPAAWYGTRLTPLVASLLPLVVISIFSLLIVAFPWLLGLMFLAAFDVVLIVLILYVIQNRDFA